MSEPRPINPEVAEADALDQERDVDPEPETQMLLRQAEDHIGRTPAIAV